MTFEQFILKYNGMYVEVAGTVNALYQCTDLGNAYLRDVLNLPIIEWTNAIDYPSKAGNKYDWILNTPEGIPQKGDLVIFNIGQYGHISIFLLGDTNQIITFDQNFPLGSKPHTVFAFGEYDLAAVGCASVEQPLVLREASTAVAFVSTALRYDLDEGKFRRALASAAPVRPNPAALAAGTHP